MCCNRVNQIVGGFGIRVGDGAVELCKDLVMPVLHRRHQRTEKRVDFVVQFFPRLVAPLFRAPSDVGLVDLIKDLFGLICLTRRIGHQKPVKFAHHNFRVGNP